MCIRDSLRPTSNREAPSISLAARRWPKISRAVSTLSLIHIYAEELRQNHTQRTHIERICAYVQGHLTAELTLERVAREAYLSRCYICLLYTSSCEV